MRKILLIIGIALMVSCAPGKKDTPTIVDIYCNSCYLKVQNMWFEAPGANSTKVYEYPFDGIVTNYQRVEVYRFDSPNSCVRPTEYANYSTDTTWIYIIENTDTIAALENGGNGYCY